MKLFRISLTLTASIYLMFALVAISVKAEVVHLDEILAKADSGDAIAMRQMGDIYLKGEEVDRDLAKAAQWYQKSAAKDNIYGMGNLATLYYEGAGIPQDYKLAQQYALPAATGGYHQALLIMAKLAATPDAGMQDPVEFIKWGLLAANAGNIDALNLLVTVGDQVGWADIEKGIAKADSFKIDFSKALYETHPFEPCVSWSYNAQAEYTASIAWKRYVKAVHEVTGEGMVQDTSAGVSELRFLSHEGFAHATWALAIIYSDGKFVPQDNAKTFEYTSLAATQKHAEAQYQLGVMYFRGQGTAIDTAKGIDNVRAAAYNGHAQAQYDYAVILVKGIGGLTPDLIEAYAWLLLSVELGNAQAELDLPNLEVALSPEQKTKAEERKATLRSMLGK